MQVLLLKVLKDLYDTPVPSLTTGIQFLSLDTLHPNLSWKHLPALVSVREGE